MHVDAKLWPMLTAFLQMATTKKNAITKCHANTESDYRY